MSLPRASSGVIILRQISDFIEVLMLQRAKSVVFGGSWAFVGGNWEEADRHTNWSGILSGNNTRVQGMGEVQSFDDADRKITAFREVYEEVGLVLTTNFPKDPTFPSFYDFCKSNAIQVNLNELLYFGRFVTPSAIKTRYDTTFYLHPIANPQPSIQLDKNESQAYEWIEPLTALSKFQIGKFPLTPPVAWILYQLGHYDNLENLVDANQLQSVYRDIQPTVVGKEGGLQLALPGDKQCTTVPWENPQEHIARIGPNGMEIIVSPELPFLCNYSKYVVKQEENNFVRRLKSYSKLQGVNTILKMDKATNTSALIVCRQLANNFEILILQHREANIWGRAHSYVGGAQTPVDLVSRYKHVMPEKSRFIFGNDDISGFVENDRKLTALRYAYDEIGLVISTWPWIIDDQSVPFYQFCLDKRIRLDTEALHFLGWHVAPPLVPNRMRINVPFYFYNLPADTTLHINEKLFDNYYWVDPLKGLKMYNTGEVHFTPPLIYTLYELAHFDNVEEMIKANNEVPTAAPYMGKILRAGQRIRIVYPGDYRFSPSGKDKEFLVNMMVYGRKSFQCEIDQKLNKISSKSKYKIVKHNNEYFRVAKDNKDQNPF